MAVDLVALYPNREIRTHMRVNVVRLAWWAQAVGRRESEVVAWLAIADALTASLAVS